MSCSCDFHLKTINLKLQIISVFVDCLDAYNKGMTGSGAYTIKPDGHTEMRVQCDMEQDGGGWTVSTACVSHV